MGKLGLISVVLFYAFVLFGCPSYTDPVSDTGIRKAQATVPVGSDGLTIEQRNIIDRLAVDNNLGAIKHLYVISAMSGQVIIYSTVRGKVTSSGKRLTPYAVSVTGGTERSRGIPVEIGGQHLYTAEVLQDDGTYGSSIHYLFWWDSQGRYHQHYISGGQIIHISDQPLAVKNIILNLETIGSE